MAKQDELKGPEDNSEETPKQAAESAKLKKMMAEVETQGALSEVSPSTESGEKNENALTAEAVKRVLENDLNIFKGGGIATGPAHSEKEIGDYFGAKVDKILRDKFSKLFSEGTKIRDIYISDQQRKENREDGPDFDLSSNKVSLQLGTEDEYYGENSLAISFLYTYMGDGVSPVISDLVVSDLSTKDDFFSKRATE